MAPSLSTLQQELRKAIATGQVTLNAETLQSYGFTLPNGLDSLIEQSFQIHAALVIDYPQHGPVPVLTTLEGTNTQILVVSGGQAAVLGTSVMALTLLFLIDESNTLQFVVQVTPPPNWTLGGSLPMLVGFPGAWLTLDDQVLFFATSTDFGLDTSYTLSPDPGGNITQNIVWKPVQGAVAFTPGLDFGSHFKTGDVPILQTLLTFLGAGSSGNQLALIGSVQPPAAGSRQRYPTVDMQVTLSSSSGLKIPGLSGSAFTLDAPRLEIVSAFDSYPFIALVLDATLAGIRLDARMALRSGSIFSLSLGLGKFNSVGDLFKVLADDSGVSSLWNALPPSIKSAMASIQFLGLDFELAIGSNVELISLSAAVGGGSLQLGDLSVDGLMLRWTCLSPTSSPLNSFTFRGGLTLFSKYRFNVSVEVATGGDFSIAGQFLGDVSLSELVKDIGITATLPIDVSLREFDLGLQHTGSTKQNRYQVGATLDVDLHLFGKELLALRNTRVTLDIDGTSKRASLNGVLDILGLDFDVAAEIASGGDISFRISMVGRTLGELLGFLAHLVDPNLSLTLPSPWNALGDIRMDALVLSFSMKHETQPAPHDRIDISLTYSDDIKLGFIDIESISLTYVSTTIPSQEDGLQIDLTCSFFGKSYGKDGSAPLGWDAMKQPPPTVPGKSGALDLRYLGLGQHVALKDATAIATVYEALNKLGDAYSPVVVKPPGQKQGSPIEQLPALEYSDASEWLIGADFTLIDTFTLGCIFNDPELYGLYITLSGAKAKIFAGLSFQILYKKISDSVGEYYVQLKLPDAMRHLEFGEVSVTLPVITVSIYTNGNFLIDFGFPYNASFVNSFAIEAFPFTGAGGFYFGVLDGQTTSHLPAVSNGSFHPVIVFGFGLQVGVGKTIDEGILSAGIDIVVEGILEGTLAFFHPDDPRQNDDVYYRVQGTVGIVGHLYGTINFAIVKASVDALANIMTRATIESYQPVELDFTATVSVQLSIQIAVINIHLSFRASIHEHFTIGSASTPPWRVSAGSGGGVSRAASRLVARGPMVMMARGPMPEEHVAAVSNPWTWAPFSWWTSKQTAKVYLTPNVTVADGQPAVATLLFIENAGVDGTGGTPDFENLAQAMLAWALAIYTGAPDAKTLASTAVNAGDLAFIHGYLVDRLPPTAFVSKTKGVSAAQSSAMWTTLQDQGYIDAEGRVTTKVTATSALPVAASLVEFVRGILLEWQTDKLFTMQELSAFIEQNVELTLQPHADASLTGTIFPMPSCLAMTYPDPKPGGSTLTTSFGKPITTLNPAITAQQYVDAVETYFSLIGAAATTTPNRVVAEQASVAELIFKDYFTAMLQSLVQAAGDVLSSYPHELAASDTFGSLATTDAEIEAMARANQADGKVLDSDSGKISVTGLVHVVTAGESLDDVVSGLKAEPGFTYDSLVEPAIQYMQVLQPQVTLTLANLSYTVPAEDALTPAGIAARFYTDPSKIIGDGSYDAHSTATVRALTTLRITGIAFAVPSAGNLDTLAKLSFYFGATPEAIEQVNPKLDFSGPLKVGTNVVIPDVSYVVPPYDFALVSIYFDLSLNALQSANPSVSSPLFGETLSIPTATYVVQADDSLFSIQRWLFLDALSSLTTVAHASTSLLMPGAALPVPTFSHAIASGETLADLAHRYDTDVGALALANKTTTGLFAAGQTWLIPDASIEVGALFGTLLKQGKIYETAGLLSRFLLHGLRLPDVDQTFPSSPTDPDWAALKMKGVYGQLGQQFAVDGTRVSTSDAIDLVADSPLPWWTSAGLPSWIQLSGFPLNFSANEVSLLENIAAAASNLTFSVPTQISPYDTVGATYTLQHAIPWQCAAPLAWSQPSDAPPLGSYLWPLPSSLSKRLLVSPLPELTLEVGTPSTGDSPLVSNPVGDYLWATRLQVKIRRLADAESSSGMAQSIYQLEGVDESDRHLLSKLIARATGATAAAYILYAQDPVLSSDGLITDMRSLEDGENITIVKTNLATLDNTDGDATVTAALTAPKDFLDLLFECSVIGGGYYLTYNTTSLPAGLPAYVFGSGREASSTLLVSFADDSSIQPYHNCLIKRGAIDTRHQVFFARESVSTGAKTVVRLGAGKVGFETDEPKPKPANALIDLANLEQGDSASSGDGTSLPTITGPIEHQGRQAWKCTFTSSSTWGSMSWAPTGSPATPSDPKAVTVEFAACVDPTTVTAVDFKIVAGSDSGTIFTLDPPLSLGADWKSFSVKLSDFKNQGYSPAAGLAIQQAFAWGVNQGPVTLWFAADGVKWVDGGGGVATPAQVLAQAYHLLGYHIAKTPDFAASVEGLPVGPADDASVPSVYRYTGVVPVPNDSSSQNPYASVGKQLELVLSLHDIHGNTLQPSSLASNLALDIKYHDLLVPTSAYPGLALAYDFQPQPGVGTTLQVYLDLSVIRYAPVGSRTLAACLKKAVGDARRYALIGYQLGCSDVEVELSIPAALGSVGASPVSGKQPIAEVLQNFAQQAHAYLVTLQSLAGAGELAPVIVQPSPNTTKVSTLLEHYDLAHQVESFAMLNQGVDGLFDSSATLSFPILDTLSTATSLTNLVALANATYGLTLTVDTLAQTIAKQVGVLASGVEIAIPTSTPQSYTTGSWDTLQGIVSKYSANPEVTLKSLAEANQNNSLLLRQGAIIEVGSITHTPAAADSLATLAEWFVSNEHGTLSPAQILAANRDQTLGAGVMLTIPSASTLSEPTPLPPNVLVLDRVVESLDAIATSKSVETGDLFLVNLTLIGILSGDPVTMEIEIDGTSKTLSVTPGAEASLASVYDNLLFELATAIVALQSGSSIVLSVQITGIAKALQLTLTPADSPASVLATLSQDIQPSTFAAVVASQKVIGKATGSVCLLVPPMRLTTAYPITPQQPKDVVEVWARASITRTDDTRIYEEGGNPPAAVKSALADMVPHLLGSSDVDGISLRQFAAGFEQAFASQSLRLGASKSDDVERGRPQHLYAVPISPGVASPSSTAFSFSFAQQQPMFFAPTPLATKPISRTQIALSSYISGSGLIPGPRGNIDGVDLDAWGRRFLQAIDDFLAPESAVPANVISPKSFATVIQAKQKLADAIAGSTRVILAAQTQSNTVAGRQAAAREAMREHLLAELASAYDVDAIVQYDVTVGVPTGYSNELPPRLYGKPVVNTLRVPATPGDNTLSRLAKIIGGTRVIDVAYLAYCMQDLQNILSTSTLISATIPPGTGKVYTYEPNADDTLQTVLEQFRTESGQSGYTLAELASAIATQPILAPNQALALVWVTYEVSRGDSLQSIGEYFEQSTAVIAVANRSQPGILQPGTISYGGHTATITPSSTIDSVFADLQISLDGDPATIVIPQPIATSTELLNQGAPVGVVINQAAFALSSASLTFSTAEPYLNFLFSQPGEQRDRVFLDLRYQASGLEFDRQAIDGLPGYEDYSGLTFVRGLPAVPLTPAGSVAIPVPKRAYPPTPMLVGQSAQATQQPMPPLDAGDLDKLEKWVYSFTYDYPGESTRNTVVAGVSFSVSDEDQGGGVEQISNDAANSDLPTALAQFMSVYPALARDLGGLATMARGSSSDTLTAAVEAFATLVEQVATAWAGWSEVLDEHDAEVYDFECTIKEFVDEGVVNVEVTHSYGELPGPYSLPYVVAPGYTTSPSLPPTDQPTQLYTLTPTANGGASTQRTLRFCGLNVVSEQNAWGGISVSSNQDLLRGQVTNPDFVYSTPVVRFRDKAQPLIEVTSTIVIGSAPAPLDQQLGEFFKTLLDFGEIPDNTSTPLPRNRLQRLRLACRLLTPVASSSSVEISTPVLMHPNLILSMDDCQYGAGAPDNVTNKLAKAIETWMASHALAEAQEGAYQLELTLYSSPSEQQMLLRFLAGNTTSYLPWSTSRTDLPLSFYVDNSYWNEFQDDKNDIEGMAERVLATFGADIYDIATVQIAFSIFPEFREGMRLAQAWTERLSGNQSGTLLVSSQTFGIRGYNTATPFTYGGSGNQPLWNNSYFFRMIADQYYLQDPLTSALTWPDLGQQDPKPGDPITWFDWKPITGENAWANMLGPLQLAYRQYGGIPPFDSQAVQLAIAVLPCYEAMAFPTGADDFPTGAIYYAPEGTVANEGGLVNPYQVSNENNFSSYAGLTMLLEILLHEVADETDADTRTTIEQTIARIEKLAGGIRNYFSNPTYALYDGAGDLDEAAIYASGNYGTQAGRSKTFTPDKIDTPAGFAVDVHTWGMAVLGADFVDENWGASMKPPQKALAYRLWQNVKQRAGYFQEDDKGLQRILGVGYTDVHTISGPDQGSHSYIISGEWSFGAINMCRVLAYQYRQRYKQTGDPDFWRYAQDLEADAESMVRGVHTLLLDTSREGDGKLAIYYANRRYAIPFGWYSNKVASACSTAWGLMVDARFNPFVLGGSYSRQCIDPTNPPLPQSSAKSARANVEAPLQDQGVPADHVARVSFLTENQNANVRVRPLPDANPPVAETRTGMPLSFYVTHDYYQNTLTGTSVADVIERVELYYGLDLYHAAVTQIALAQYSDYENGMRVAFLQTERLRNGFARPLQTTTDVNTIRAWSNVSANRFFNHSQGNWQLLYGPKQEMINPNLDTGAYYFRLISDQDLIAPDPKNPMVLLRDPNLGATKYPDSITVDGTPYIHWTNFEARTGPTIWAALIGPLQLGYRRYEGLPPRDSEEVELALSILSALEAMRAPNGAILGVPENTYEYSDATPTELAATEVYNVDNLLVFAGLTMLARVLEEYGDQQYLPRVRGLLAGVESYLESELYDASNHVFFAGGAYDDEYATFTKWPTATVLPVDVQVWGALILGPQTMDSWFGAGAGYRLWQQIESEAGLRGASGLEGVGYSRDDNDVIAVDLSFAAVLLCNTLAEADATNAAALRADAQSMSNYLKANLLDQTSFDDGVEAYYFASARKRLVGKRNFSAWNANKVDSLVATAWSLLAETGINPFVLGGEATPGLSSTMPVRPLMHLHDVQLPLAKVSQAPRTAQGRRRPV